MGDFDAIKLERKTGAESFRDGDRPLGFNVLGFWQWSTSDLVSNATRGILAEYLVAQALGVAGEVREEWAAYDLTAEDGTRVEVKSAAYVQTWTQGRLSSILFSVRKTYTIDPLTGKVSSEARRQADVYVFALLHEKDKRRINALDLSQWTFYVVPTVHLDNRTRSQDSITLPSLEQLRILEGVSCVEFAGIREAVRIAAEVQRRRPNSGAAVTG